MGLANVHVLMPPFLKVDIAGLIQRLHICKLAYSIKCICNPHINTSSDFVVIWRHGHVYIQSSEKFESPDAHVPGGGRTGRHSAFLIQLSHRTRVSCSRSLQCRVFPCLCSLLLTWLFKMSPEHSAEALLSVRARSLRCALCVTAASFRRE